MDDDARLPLRQISRGGAGHRPGRLARRWTRFWLRWNGVGPFGRLASRLAAWAAPPGLAQVGLAWQTPRGYIDADTTVYHSDFRVGRHVYLGAGVSIFENDNGGRVTLADKVAIHRGAVLETGQGGYIDIGAGSSVHPGCQVKAYVQPVVIGEGVMLAANVAIYSYDHGMAPDVPIRKQPLSAKGPVSIDHEAWIGTGAIILSGVTIGEGAVVAAGAVVTKDIPAGAIAVGNPARVIRHRNAMTDTVSHAG
jgi:acetyltransferase-like isoleucine patch superfamily enzyme